MSIINSILNLAALLLWLGWRDLVVGSLLNNTTTPLVRTLRRADNARLKVGKHLLALGGLLLLRALLVWWLAGAVNWTPRLNLTAITLHFRSELLGQAMLFSCLSFGATLAVFYTALLLLSVLDNGASDGNPLQKFVRSHLGRAGRLPSGVRLLLPVAVTMLVWLALAPVLTHGEIVPAVAGIRRVLQQGLLLGIGLCLVWKLVLSGVLLAYFLNSYIYFGEYPVWSYAGGIARRLLMPLQWLPLRVGRVDFTAVVGMVLVFFIGTMLANGLSLGGKTWLASLAERYQLIAR
jgi:uncharacterized protein YggT (Ycf19 family)